MALIREETRPKVPRRKPPKVPISRRKPPGRRTRRITLKTIEQAYVRAPGTEIYDPEKVRAKALDLLTPSAQVAFALGRTQVEVPQFGAQPQYSALTNTLSLPVGTPANAVRHELMHTLLSRASSLFPNVPREYKQAHSLEQQLRGGIQSAFGRPELQTEQRRLQETAAITFGGAEAYPGYQPAFNPWQFQNVFNVQAPSWQYPRQISPTQENRWNTYR